MLTTYDLPTFGTGLGETSSLDFSGTTVSRTDPDIYTFDLDPGDILGVNLIGDPVGLALKDGSGDSIVIANGKDIGTALPGAVASGSPLFPGGDSSIGYVVTGTTSFSLEVTDGGASNGDYDLELRVYRPVLEQQPIGSTQFLYLDFDGASSLDMEALFGSGLPGATPLPSNVTVPGIASYLADWGLSASQETELIEAIEDVVEDNLLLDIGLGLNGSRDSSLQNGDFDIEIITSLENADIFGLPNVSRVIVGGDGTAVGLPGVIGFAESVDVGNFNTEETAMVFLDSLAGPATSLNSINHFTLHGSATMVDLVAEVVGNIISHEAGHFFGNWHTNPNLAPFGIMDHGNAGIDQIAGSSDGYNFGNADDIDVDFIVDSYGEGFPVPNFYNGTQDTANVIAMGLSTGTTTGFYFDPITRKLTYTGDDSPSTVTLSGTGILGEVQADDGTSTITYTNVSSLELNTFDGVDILHLDSSLSSALPTGTVTFNAGSGADTIRVTQDSDYILTNSSLQVGSSSIDLTGVENGWLTGGSSANDLDASLFTGDATLVGGDGNDTLTGGSGNDTLVGGDGDDTLNGGLGDDVYKFEEGDGGNDVIAESASQGIDEFDFSDYGLMGANWTNISVDLANTSQQTVNPSRALKFTIQNAAAIEKVTGTIHGDFIYGNALTNVLDGGDGNDIIDGRESADVIFGGAGLDILFGRAGNDAISGGDGADWIYGGDDNDTLYGGAGNDNVFGELGDDFLYGGVDDDSIDGGGGTDYGYGGDGVDTEVAVEFWNTDGSNGI